MLYLASYIFLSGISSPMFLIRLESKKKKTLKRDIYVLSIRVLKKENRTILEKEN